MKKETPNKILSLLKELLTETNKEAINKLYSDLCLETIKTTFVPDPKNHSLDLQYKNILEVLT